MPTATAGAATCSTHDDPFATGPIPPPARGFTPGAGPRGGQPVARPPRLGTAGSAAVLRLSGGTSNGWLGQPRQPPVASEQVTRHAAPSEPTTVPSRRAPCAHHHVDAARTSAMRAIAPQSGCGLSCCPAADRGDTAPSARRLPVARHRL